MESTQIQYIKTKNRLQRHYGVSVGTKILQKKIAAGLLPQEFLQFIQIDRRKKSAQQKARERFNSNQKLKNSIYARDGRRCRKCGGTHSLEIDHIRPIFRFPELAQEKSNLQVLCKKCNGDKGYSIACV